MTKPSTLILLATYNEIENLPRLVAEIFAQAPGADILVVDDNSPDGTGNWCDQHAVHETRLHCIHRPGKLGLGTATVAGMQFAIERGYDYVLNMDADFSHAPRFLPLLMATNPGDSLATAGTPDVDVLIGSRYIPGGAIEGWPWQRHLMSRMVNASARFLLGLKPLDCSGAFRRYRTSALQRVDLDRIQSRGYSFQEEILWQLKRKGASMAEVPIVFVDRQRGSSKINLREAFSAMGVIIHLAAKRAFSAAPAANQPSDSSAA